MNHYDHHTICIKKVTGEILVRIDRVIVSSCLRIPHKEPYELWTFEESGCLYEKKKKDYDSIVAHTWLLRLALGGSRLPKPLTIEHVIKEITNIVFLLNRVKGNEHAFH